MNTTLAATDLVQRLKARDAAALDELIELHGSRLYAVALQITRNDADAREVVQDALIAIWQKIGSFENRSAFTTWLHRVTANTALMKLRKTRRFDQHFSLDQSDDDDDLPALQLAAPGDSPDSTAVRDELATRVQAAIDALPEPYRTTVILSDIDEFSMEEISTLTGVTVPAVKSRLHRGRLALRKALEKYLNRS